MKGSTVALLALGVAGAGAGVYFLVIRPRQKAALPAGYPGQPAVQGPPASGGPSIATRALSAVPAIATGLPSAAVGLAGGVVRFGVQTAVAIPVRTATAVIGAAKSVATTAVTSVASGVKSILGSIF